MKALVVNAIGRGFDFEDVDIATPIGREVLVDVQASGLCHTDLLFASRPRRDANPHRGSRGGFACSGMRSVRSVPVRPSLPVQISGVDTAPLDRTTAPKPQWHWFVSGVRPGRVR
jgi:NADPH:quinone reductase-like Zn-dependent oxidoreductase